MKKNVILSTLLIATGFLLAQPGKPKGPGGQYSERMEMMMVWKLTDHLELSQSQAEKFFPVMRAHQKQLMEIRKEEKELFEPTFTKVKKGETVTKSDVNRLLGNIKSFEEKKTKGRIDFIKKSGDILNSNQQIKLLMFEPTVKQQIQKRMKESYRPPMRGGKQKGKRRF
tara:strand:+ start:186 stop:692 length:507 start_codon:yes stop_codon:yes gene_type:complete